MENLGRMPKHDPTSVHCDSYFTDHKQYWAEAEKLQKEGFRYHGNVCIDHYSYTIFVSIDEKTAKNYPILWRKIMEARAKQSFINDIEEQTWILEDRGFEVYKIPAFKAGERLEGLIAFFVRKQDK